MKRFLLTDVSAIISSSYLQSKYRDSIYFEDDSLNLLKYQLKKFLWLIKCCKIQRNNSIHATKELFWFNNLFTYSTKEIFSLIQRIIYIFKERIVFIQRIIYIIMYYIIILYYLTDYFHSPNCLYIPPTIDVFNGDVFNYSIDVFNYWCNNVLHVQRFRNFCPSLQNPRITNLVLRFSTWFIGNFLLGNFFTRIYCSEHLKFFSKRLLLCDTQIGLISLK